MTNVPKREEIPVDVVDALYEVMEAHRYQEMITNYHARTAFSTAEISDRRAKEIELNLGHRMLQKVGIVPAPYIDQGKNAFSRFLHHFKAYLDSRVFTKDTMKSSLPARTSCVTTPSGIPMSLSAPCCTDQKGVSSIVRTAVVIIDEASQPPEPTPWPILAHFTAPDNEALTANLQFGDHFQIRLIVASALSTNPFRVQLRVPVQAICSRQSGFPMLLAKRRMHPGVADLVSSAVYQNGLVLYQDTHHFMNATAKRLRTWNKNVFWKGSNPIVIEVTGTSRVDMKGGMSCWNPQQVVAA